MVLVNWICFIISHTFWYIILPFSLTQETRLFIGVSNCAVLVAYWVACITTDKKRGGYNTRDDVRTGLKLVVFAAVMAYASLFGFKKLFFARTSAQYLLVEQLKLPLVIFQATFLGFISLLLLPLFFKLYGFYIFGRYTMIMEKGFDEAAKG